MEKKTMMLAARGAAVSITYSGGCCFINKNATTVAVPPTTTAVALRGREYHRITTASGDVTNLSRKKNTNTNHFPRSTSFHHDEVSSPSDAPPPIL
jgi:hypothetical protein